jgi:outer membrane protein OmpA-like peptidoglycan-associated protein
VLVSRFVHLSLRLIVEEKSMFSRVSKSLGRLLVLACVVAIPLALGAQESTKPAAKASVGDSPSKWDIFAGYSFLAPKGTVNGFDYTRVNAGAIGSITGYFNKNIGVQIEGDFHNDGNESTPHDDFGGFSGGVIYRFPGAKLTPFVHALIGAESVGSYYQTNTWGPVVTAGGGLDWNITHHVAWRIFQADYQYTHEDFAGGVSGNFNAARLSTGLVFGIGSIAPPEPVTVACSASPASVFPGDPIALTATAGGLNPKLNAIYSWEGTGVTGTGTSATVATGTLAPGAYTVKCGVKEGKPGKEGLKPWELAEASTSFTVKAFEPPTISCSASPSTLKPGDPATVTATGVSPQNRPLTYSFSATSGSINGTGATANFSSVGAPTGPVGITCNVTDDKGQTATANTSVTITAPYVAPIPHSQALCSISFTKDTKRPTRVDNEAKACLDEVALDLQKQSDAKAVVVGNSDAKEKEKLAKEEKAAEKHKHLKVKVVDPAAERAVNTKDYLVTEKGIDASRISVATSTADDQNAQDYLVPSGATFTADVTGTTPVDEAAVKVQPRKALPAKHAHKKAAAKKAVEPAK